MELKTGFQDRMKVLLGDDFDKFIKSLSERPVNSIRVNELKISPEELKRKLEEKGWKISQPIKGHPEIFVIESQLEPGEIGRTFEHLLGYYYVQEISSMLPVIVLNPKPGERVLDLCASPGSKTTEIASFMKNTGLLIANDPDFGRMKILSSNLERCGVSNVIVTRKEGSVLCNKLLERDFMFDKILVDAPCSGEGTLRISPKTALMWNPNGIKRMSSIQKRLLSYAIKILKIGGELVYSTCTYAPEEDEEVIDFVLKEFPEQLEIEKISLPIKCRDGITNWYEKDYDSNVQKTCRIFPFDNNTEGFFITKIRRKK